MPSVPKHSVADRKRLAPVRSDDICIDTGDRNTIDHEGIGVLPYSSQEPHRDNFEIRLQQAAPKPPLQVQMGPRIGLVDKSLHFRPVAFAPQTTDQFDQQFARKSALRFSIQDQAVGSVTLVSFLPMFRNTHAGARPCLDQTAFDQRSQRPLDDPLRRLELDHQVPHPGQPVTRPALGNQPFQLSPDRCILGSLAIQSHSAPVPKRSFCIDRQSMPTTCREGSSRPTRSQ